MVTVQRFVQQPFLHRGVIHHVGRPLVACHRRTLILPAVGIEVTERHGFAQVVLHLDNPMRAVGIGKAHLLACGIGKKRTVRGFSTAHRKRPGSDIADGRRVPSEAQMGAYHIEDGLRRVGDRIVNNRGIVHGPATVGSLLVGTCQVGVGQYYIIGPCRGKRITKGGDSHKECKACFFHVRLRYKLYSIGILS